MSSNRGEPVLSVRNLTKHYPITAGMLKNEVGTVKAVDGIDFDVYEGETFGIVGESGCGKSTAATSMIRLEEPTDGEVLYRGENIVDYDAEQLTRFRRELQMIFQDPDSSFDPRMSIGNSLAEPLTVQGLTDQEHRNEIIDDLLRRIDLSPEDKDRYPHEFSGGQKQRLGIARALSVNPDVIVADEPVSALDVSIQSEILALLRELQDAFGLTMVVISHNLSVIRSICDRVAVMYLGEIVEKGPTEEVFNNPQHPYTRALISSIPTPDPTQRGMGIELKGDVPSSSNPPSGCRFHTRCPEVIQPEEVDLEQREWRRVLDFRQHVEETGIDLEGVREVVAANEGHSLEDDVENLDLPADRLAAEIRRDFELEEPLSQQRAEETLQEAVQQLIAGNREAAIETLQGLFTTPCEEQSPALQSVASDHVASCLLHTERYAERGDQQQSLYTRSD